MNKDDNEFFNKVNTKKVIELPYKFSYLGWMTTITRVKTASQGIKVNDYYVFSKHYRTYEENYLFCTQKLNIEEVIKRSKKELSIVSGLTQRTKNA